jgi:hypothetical protein
VDDDILYEEKIWRPKGTDSLNWEVMKFKAARCDRCIVGYPWPVEDTEWKLVLIHRHQSLLPVEWHG